MIRRLPSAALPENRLGRDLPSPQATETLRERAVRCGTHCPLKSLVYAINLSPFDESEQIGVEDIGMGSREAVIPAGINFQHAVLEQLH